jgi:hypothetical protein
MARNAETTRPMRNRTRSQKAVAADDAITAASTATRSKAGRIQKTKRGRSKAKKPVKPVAAVSLVETIGASTCPPASQLVDLTEPPPSVPPPPELLPSGPPPPELLPSGPPPLLRDFLPVLSSPPPSRNSPPVPSSPPLPIDYDIELKLAVQWNRNRLSTPQVYGQGTRQSIDFLAIEAAIRSVLNDHQPDVDIDTLPDQAINIHGIVKDSSAKVRRETEVVKDLGPITEIMLMDHCDEMHRKIHRRAKVGLEIVYRVIYYKPASVARETPRQSYQRAPYRPGSTPVSEATFLERGSSPSAPIGRRTRELRDNADARTETVRRGAKVELELKNRWTCPDENCINFRRWCWISRPGDHYPIDEVKIGRWTNQVKSGSGTLLEIPQDLLLHLAGKGTVKHRQNRLKEQQAKAIANSNSTG